MARLTAIVAVLAVVTTLALWATPTPASAVSPTSALCNLTGLVSGLLGKACTVATHAGDVISAGKQLLSGRLGSAVSALSGGGVAGAVGRGLALGAVALAVTAGAHALLHHVATLISATTSPELGASWFSGPYWRMAAVAALLTVPFLCAAAVQALVRSDLALLGRAAFGWLPLGMLAVGVAAPITMLLLAASDELSAIVSSAAGHAGTAVLERNFSIGVASGVTGSLFVWFFVGLVAAAGALGLWVELLIRQAAVYVIVLMLPLFFAAMVWPARRVWAARAVELLVALILSKFAIVAVLSLGGAALDHAPLGGVATLMTGTTLVLLACLCPWALMRLLPLHELAGAAAGGLSQAARAEPALASSRAHASTDKAEEVAAALAARLPDQSRSIDPSADDPGRQPHAAACSSSRNPDDGETRDGRDAERLTAPVPEGGEIDTRAAADGAARAIDEPGAAAGGPPAAFDEPGAAAGGPPAAFDEPGAAAGGPPAAGKSAGAATVDGEGTATETQTGSPVAVGRPATGLTAADGEDPDASPNGGSRSVLADGDPAGGTQPQSAQPPEIDVLAGWPVDARWPEPRPGNGSRLGKLPDPKIWRSRGEIGPEDVA